MMLLLLTLFFSFIYSLSGLNLTYYQVNIKSTNGSNVSSFEECLCKYLNDSDCAYFAYWSSLSSPSCQLYTLLEDKPEILNYTL